MSEEQNTEGIFPRTAAQSEHRHEPELDPDRRMTSAEWEREDWRMRDVAHNRREQSRHDRDARTSYDKKHQRRNWKANALWVAAGMVALLLIFLIGYLPRHQQQKRAAAVARQRTQETPQVDVLQFRRSNASGELTVPGTTASMIEAYLYARANGYLSKRFADIGNRVKKGQLLALIDAPDLDRQVDQAREQLDQAKAQLAQQQAQLNLNRVTWERWRILVAKGVFSRQDGDQREADFLAQQALVASVEHNVESYRANLDRMIALQRFERITAPFDGIVTQRNSDVGALLGTSGSAATAPVESAQSPSSGSASIGSTNTSGTTGTQNQSAASLTGGAQGGPVFTVAQIDTPRILVSVPEGSDWMKAQLALDRALGNLLETSNIKIDDAAADLVR